jgi:hypothetical protein
MMIEICIATYTCLVQFLQKVSFHGPESKLEEDDGITTPLLLHYDDVSSRQVSAWCCSFTFWADLLLLNFKPATIFFSMTD